MPVQTKLQVRRDTAANWTSVNPTLSAGEFGYETDTGKVKIGTGSTAWTSLAYVGSGASITISDTPPTSPTAGNLWFESDTTRTYVYYNSSWVEIGSIPTIQYLNDIGDVQAATPITGQVLQWNGTNWVPAIAAGGGLNTTTDGAIITMAIGA
jgi:hypothetical protein